MNGTLYFTAYTPATGYQVWQSDGTAARTVMDTNLNTGGTQIPGNFAAASSDLYFTAPGASMWQWVPSSTMTSTITSADARGIAYGTRPPSTRLDAIDHLVGTFADAPAKETDIVAGDGQTLSVHLMPTETDDHSSD
jgi:ELWxxDGT repeat protein